MKRSLTHTFIEHHPNPEKRIEIYDKKPAGFAVRITPSGKKTFVYRYYYAGKNKRITIGSFESISLGDARKLAFDYEKLLWEGTDPFIERYRRRSRIENISFKECAEIFIKEHIPKLKESTQRDYKSRINKHLIPEFGSIPIKDIQRAHVRRFLKPIADKQAVHANRLQAVLSKIFSFAINEELTSNHPLKKMPKFGQEVRRDRFYSKKEIRAIWLAFEQQGEPMRSLLMTLLLTGQRLGEVSRMRWGDIDVNRGLWVIPEEDTKASRTHILPILGELKSILENLHSITGHREFVFTSPMNKEKHLNSFKPVTERIREMEDVPIDFRLHDLRRTVATYMAEMGTDRTTLGKILNHKGLSGDNLVTSIYDRHDYMDQKKRALSLWDSYLKQIITEEKGEPKIFKIG